MSCRYLTVCYVRLCTLCYAMLCVLCYTKVMKAISCVNDCVCVCGGGGGGGEPTQHFEQEKKELYHYKVNFL